MIKLTKRAFIAIYLMFTGLTGTLFAESLNITTVDTGYYPANDNISFYFSLLDDSGNPLTELNEKGLELYERDLKSGKEYKVEQFKVEPTDKKLKSANFLFLVDNSLSMYRLVVPTRIEQDILEHNLFPQLTAAEKRYLLSHYRLTNGEYQLAAEPSENHKKRIKSLLERAGIEVKNRIETVKDSLEIFLQSMPPELDNKMLVSFNEKSSSMESFTKSGNQVQGQLEGIEKPTETTGWTELYEALDESSSMLSPRGGRSFLILLSDGYQRSASEEDKSTILEEAVKRATEMGIVIFTIGFGGEVDHALLKDLASETGGININANDTGFLNDAYTRIANIIYNEFKVTYKGKNLLPEERELTLRYRGLEKSKSFKISSIYGKSLSPYPWLLLLLIALSLLIFLLLLLKFLKKEVKENSFINLDSSTKIITGGDTRLFNADEKGADTSNTIWLAGKEESTKVVKKEEGYVLEGENTYVNNNEISGTRVLKEGDVITTSTGTRLLFSGTFKLEDKDKGKK